MTNILVVAEHDHATLKAATLNTVTAAQNIGGEIHMLVAGNNCAGAADNSGSVTTRRVTGTVTGVSPSGRMVTVPV